MGVHLRTTEDRTVMNWIKDRITRIMDRVILFTCWVFGHDSAPGRTWCVYCGKDRS